MLALPRRVIPACIGIALTASSLAAMPSAALAVEPVSPPGAVPTPILAHTDATQSHDTAPRAVAPATRASRALSVTVATCSQSELIAAVAAVATTGGTINLRPGCTYTLTGPTPNNDDNGLPVITAAVTINGNGDTITRDTSAATAKFRIFEVDAPGNLTLNSLTISKGWATNTSFGGNGLGGGAYVNGASAALTLSNSTITGNTADRRGGGVYDNGGTVGFSSSALSQNVAGTNTTLSGGGGIYLQDGTATFSSSRITGNQLTTTGTSVAALGAGVLVDSTSTATLASTFVTGNQANAGQGQAQGGGIQNQGALTMNSSPVQNNTAISNASLGGGLLNTGNILNLNSSLIQNNTANGTSFGFGGGMYNSGTATLRSSSILNNTANGDIAFGGGVHNLNTGTIDLNSSPVQNNTANGTSFGFGGGIFNEGTATLRRSPVTGNHAIGPTAAQGGGGIYNNGGTVTLISSPVVGNTPDNCGNPSTVSGCV